MKLMFLGSGPGLPNLENNQSSIVVQTQNYNFLLDCGEGVSQKLLKHGLNGNFLDVILISHYHPDHISGLFMLMQMFYLEGRSKPLILFLPERLSALMETMHLFYTFENRFPFKLQVYEVSEIDLIISDVSAVLTDHLLSYEKYIQKYNHLNQMQSYCFLISEAQKKLLYTSDITTFANIEPMLETADVIIVDALHPEPELILSLQDYNAQQIFLTHGISDSLNAWLKHHPTSRFSIANEDIFYEL